MATTHLLASFPYVHASLCRHAIRGEGKHEGDASEVLMTGLTWGAFMGGSSNLRYQVNFLR